MLPLLLLAAADSSAPPTDDPTQKPFLAHVVELPNFHVDARETAGKLCAKGAPDLKCDHPARVRIERRGDKIRTSVVISGVPPFMLDLPAAQLPNFDLQSARLYGGFGKRVVVLIEISFGEPNDCFVNDDGRQRLSMSFEKGEKPRAWITSYPDCKAHELQIAGDADEK